MERTAALALSNMLDAGYQGGLAAAAEFLIANSSSPAPGRNGLQ
jgi:hypothetical protein